MCAVKNSISPGYGLLDFKNLKIGFEVFLNFFPCVYMVANLFLTHDPNRVAKQAGLS